MEIRINVDNINYDSIVKAIFPLLGKNDGAAENKMANKFIRMFGKGNFASKMLSLIPQESKDNMVMHFVNDQKDFIIETLSKKMNEFGIEAEIKNIEISKD